MQVVVKRALSERGCELLRHEAEVLRLVEGPGAVRLLGTEGSPACRTLVLEDAGPATLRERLEAGHLPVEEALGIALQLAQTLGRLHARGLVHGAVAPARVALGPHHRATLLHFEEAAPPGTAPPLEPAALGRSLAWIAPEQTGHMGRSVDARSDLYALGSILYAMLVGTPPFPSADPLELVHAHLAQVPVLASIAEPRVPPAVAAIAQKLLEKAPDRRYQSAEGLAADLELALRQWRAQGDVEAFELGHGDLIHELPLPHALYGREAERAALLRAFEDAAAGGVRVVLVEGEPGVGKTSLVDDLAALVARRGARFGAGKAAVRSSNVPYQPLAQALRTLLSSGDAAGSPPEELRRTLAAAGRTPLELVPELRALVGELPAGQANLGAAEAEQRIRLAFQALVRWLSRRDEPLVLFLDDLQWADEASLLGFQALASDPDAHDLLLVGSVRPSETPPGHALHRVVAKLESLGLQLVRCELRPLDEAAVRAFLADALRAAPERVAPLADLISARTRGNPFFLRQLVRSLQRQRLLLYDSSNRTWNWELERIERVGITTNVADLLAARIGALPNGPQEVLQVSACVGPELLPSLLRDLLALSPTSLEEHLGLLAREGHLVDAGAGRLRFVHDRVQQAAYESLQPARRCELHRRIGRALLASCGEERIFHAVDQLNLGAERSEGPAARLERAILNQRAGTRARASAAHGSALGYFTIALELLDGIEAPRPLRYQLHRDAAEDAYLGGQVELSERLAREGRRFAAGIEASSALEAQRIAARMQAGRLQEALEIGAEALRALLGIELPAAGDRAASTAAQQERIETLLAGRSPEFLLERPFDAPPEERAFQLLVSRMLAPAFVADHELNTFLSAFSVAHILEQGLSPFSIPCLASYPRLLAASDAFELAERFGRAAVDLAHRSGFLPAEATARIFEATMVIAWRQSYALSVAALREAFRLGVECGELGEAVNARSAIAITGWLAGTELARVLADIDEGLSFGKRVGSQPLALYLTTMRQLVRSLQGGTIAPGRLGADEEEDAALEERVLEIGAMAEVPYRIFRGQAALLFRDFADARRQLALALPDLAGQRGYPLSTEHTFSTARLALSDPDGPVDLPFARWARDRFLVWEQSCPDNFRHRRLLLDAEIARVEGRDVDAGVLFDRSIESARRGGLLHDAALANELAGRHFLALGLERVAGLYLSEARSLYGRWGATGKVRALDEEPGLAALLREGRPGGPQQGSGSLDVRSMLEAIETISGEIRIERLLPRLVEVCIRAVGAERGVLVLEEDGAPVVRAEGSADRPVRLQQTPLAEAKEIPRATIERVRRQRTPLVLDDTSGSVDDPWLQARPAGSLLAFPIRRKEELLGTFCFGNSLATHAFTTDRVRTLQLLAPEIAVAIENARLFRTVQEEIEERRRAEASLRFLADASVLLAGSLEYEETLEHLAHLAVPALADWCVVDLLGEHGAIRRVAAAHAEPRKEPLLEELRRCFPPTLDSPQPAGEVLRSGEPRLYEVLEGDALAAVARDEKHVELLRSLGLRSAMALPLVARGRVLGAMTFAAGAARRIYTEADLRLAEELARRAALAIDNARLYRMSREAIQVREDFLSVASHELKTPITSMSVAIGSQLRRSAGGGDASLQRTLATTARGLKRLNHLVDQLLDVSQIGSGSLELHLEPVELASVVAEVVESARESIERSGSTLELDAPVPIRGRWDRRRVAEVVASLLDNAVKFGEGKRIRIHTGASDGMAILEVHDRGAGIDPERLPSIFDRFERAVSSRHFGGWGLGLYLVRRIVEAHHGTVAAESAPGQGSTFIVRLPLAP